MKRGRKGGKIGGKARARKLSDERRSEIARGAEPVAVKRRARLDGPFVIPGWASRPSLRRRGWSQPLMSRLSPTLWACLVGPHPILSSRMGHTLTGDHAVDTLHQSLEKWRQERREMAAQLAKMDAAIEGLERVIGASSRTTARFGTRENRQGGSVPWTEAVEALLRERGEPMHIKEMIEGLIAKGYRIPSRKQARDNISGAVNRKVRLNETFVNVGPGRFALLEWNHALPAKNGNGAHPHRRSLVAGSMTSGLFDVIKRYPGKGASEIAMIYSREQNETEELGKRKKDSRVTRIGQLVGTGRVIREEGKHRVP